MNPISRTDGERDEKLASLYRSTLHDEPPAALDESIRAAAHRAARAGPRLPGAALRRWRVPLSIAAVVMLSASLVALMREEAPELTETPRAQLPASSVPAQREPAETARLSGQEAGAPPNVGLKPPRQAATPSIGLRGTEATGLGFGSIQEPPATERDNVPSVLAKRAPAEAGSDEPPGNVALIPPQRPPERELRRRDTRASRFAESPRTESAPAPRPAEPGASVPASPPPGAAESTSALKSETASSDTSAREQARPLMQAPPRAAAKPVPQVAGAAAADLPPAKWLDQIEALRKQGRSDEAKAIFAEFRRRYPDYPLPDALKGWEKP